MLLRSRNIGLALLVVCSAILVSAQGLPDDVPNAARIRDYVKAFPASEVSLLQDLGPFDSIINLASDSSASVESIVLNSRPGRILRTFLPSVIVYRLGLSVLKRKYKEQGRLYTFIARKNER